MSYDDFLDQHPDAGHFWAESPEHAEVVYCRDSGNGVWFLPEKGMGIMQSKGLAVMAEIVAKL
ncbi:MAG: hypothetical protein ABI600_16720 [Luteolibacter sp.]